LSGGGGWPGGVDGAARPPAVVVGLDSITGLQSARILADHGIPVVGLVNSLGHWGSRTRVCRRILQADLMGEGLVTALEQLGPELSGPAALFPCTDLSVWLISRHRDRLSRWYRIALPAHDVVDLLMDKNRFLRHAVDTGLPVPGTVFLEDRSDAEKAAESLTFPVALKPPIKSPSWQAHTKLKAFQVHDAAELLEVYDRVSGWTDTLIAQEWVEGGVDSLYSCNAYFDAQAQPLVTFVARKIRQWPPHTGTSALGEECRNDEVLEASVALFRAVGYHGLGYVEMKRDSRTGRHLIIEPNVGRPTGRSAIAEAGGVELLYTAYCDMVDLPLPDARVQRYVGAKWIDDRRDLQSAIYFLRRGELTPREWWRSIRGPKWHAVASRSDPGPFLHDLGQSAARSLHVVRTSLVRAARSPRPVHGGGTEAPTAATPAGGAAPAGLRRAADRLRHHVRRPIARTPFLWDAAMLLRPDKRVTLARPGTAIVIEGFLRSGNTFSVAAFHLANPELHVGRHLHGGPHVLRAVRMGLPTVVLVREPRDAVLSYLIRRDTLTPYDAVLEYLDFYRTAWPARDGFVVASFDRVTHDFGSVVDEVNRRFGTSFRRFEHTPENEAAAFGIVEEMNREETGGEIVETHVGRPSPERHRRKAELEELLRAPRTAALLDEATEMYGRYAARAVGRMG
jgi:predicted ATP-grasp superfamily ATP-dependent carboligase